MSGMLATAAPLEVRMLKTKQTDACMCPNLGSIGNIRGNHKLVQKKPKQTTKSTVVSNGVHRA
jgi:hypothetical protein